MILNATNYQSLNSGSYGARPGRTSIDPAFISVLQHEISTITWTNLVIAPNDAAQCYDRIVPNHAMLSCMSHGMPPSAAACIGSTLLHAKYHLRTALNESSTEFVLTIILYGNLVQVTVLLYQVGILRIPLRGVRQKQRQ